MGWYTPLTPPPELVDTLACVWTATVEGTHRLVPDGCLDLLWLSTGTGLLCGPETSAWTFRLPPGTDAVGVRFRPGLAGPVFGLDVSELTNSRVWLDDLLGAAPFRRLADELGDLADPRAGLSGLTSAVGRWASGRRPIDPLAQRVAAGPFTAASLAADLTLTARQVHRRSLRAFGYGPSTLARLMRFQRFLAVAAHARGTLAAAAATAGYADQSHLVRDCRAITGLTPTRLLAEWLPTFPAGSDPYKTDAARPAMMPA
ncbi:MAG: DUF6597 domain-containing transcriptional factor [Acidimicrobiales bacterium]